MVEIGAEGRKKTGAAPAGSERAERATLPGRAAAHAGSPARDARGISPAIHHAKSTSAAMIRREVFGNSKFSTVMRLKTVGTRTKAARVTTSGTVRPGLEPSTRTRGSCFRFGAATRYYAK